MPFVAGADLNNSDAHTIDDRASIDRNHNHNHDPCPADHHHQLRRTDHFELDHLAANFADDRPDCDTDRTVLLNDDRRGKQAFRLLLQRRIPQRRR